LISVLFGQLKVAKMLLDHGADVRAKAANGRTALMLSAMADCRGAADTGPLEMAKYLLNHGADIHEKSDNGGTIAVITLPVKPVWDHR